VSFTVVLAKEFKEILRTKKIIVLPAVFIFFGLLGPVLLHLMPELLESQGLNISLPPPTPEQAAAEYFEAATLFGAIALILVAMGAVAEERAKGSIQIILSKPIRRSHFLLAKLLSIGGLAALSLFLGAVACLYYTQLLIGDLPVGSYLVGVLLVALFLLVLVALTILFSVVLGSQMAAGGAAIAAFFVLNILPTFGGAFRTATPHALVRLSGELLAGSSQGFGLGVAANVAVLFLVTLLSWLFFSKQEL
jgi:ABC-2 type transport system permease protein